MKLALKHYVPVVCLVLMTYNQPKHERALVNLTGYVNFANGLSRSTITWLDILSQHMPVRFINTRPSLLDLTDIPISIKNTIRTNRELSKNFSLLTDNLWLPNQIPSRLVPNSHIKIAYSMCESTKAPGPWVTILNKYFDAVFVPDPFLIGVYKNSGVRIPIFVVPLALYLDDFLKLPLKKAAHKPFTFGVSAALSRNKNISLLIEAFAAEFGNSPQVQLKIHSVWQGNLSELQATIKRLGLSNVKIHIGPLSWKEYVAFINTIDCYTLLTLGEGFSITVREAMAVGIPPIISDNTAHRTICKTNLVYAIPALKRQPSAREFYQVDVGDNFNCDIRDVRRALREVFTNYPHHLALAAERRAWAARYTLENLTPVYLNAVIPSTIILGKRNEITERHFMTNSRKLYNKYKSFQRLRSAST